MPDARTIIELDVTGLDDDEITDIRAHVNGKTEDVETYKSPVHGWTCFHCGETFRSGFGAKLHFGGRVWDKPLCAADRNDLLKTRQYRDRLQDQVRVLLASSTVVQR